MAGWLADWLVGWLLRWLDCRLELFAPGVLRLLACRVVSSSEFDDSLAARLVGLKAYTLRDYP